MSAAHSALHLGALQCHFTWDLSFSRNILLRVQDKLLDVCPDESNPWRGHIYNLLGFIQTRLGHSDKALSHFSSASEALRGPALLVNYSDLAWLHHERGEPTLSQEYLQRVEELRGEYPTEKDHVTENGYSLERDYLTERDHPTEKDHPTEEAEEWLHAEVQAEKAWTLMNFGQQQKVEAFELLEQALEKCPERVEWRSSQAIALISAHKHHPAGVPLEEQPKIQRAHQEDPGNLYLCAEYLSQRAMRGEQVEEEVEQLMFDIIPSAHSSYNGLKAALRYYRLIRDLDRAIFWAEEALEKHPQSRYVKRCAALCYKWRVLYHENGGPPQRHQLEKGVSLLKEVVKLYPDTALVKEVDLADLSSKSEPAKAEEMYQTLLQRRLEPPENQMLYNRYAKYLQFTLRDIPRSIKYHKKAARIDHDSFFKENSLKELERLKKREWAGTRTSSLSTCLEQLQCHFTWDLNRSHVLLLSVRDRLEDLLPDESNPWRGHIYNLLGFIQTRLGHSDKALSHFSSASEALRGPALLVNYSDLAWLHHERGDPTLSQEYLQRVEELRGEYPTDREKLLPEVNAEKGWTVIELCKNHRAGARLLQEALQTQERVEWRSCYVIALKAQNTSPDLVEQMKHALDQDPENLLLQVEYLDQCARIGQRVRPQAAALEAQVLLHPDRMHRVIQPLLQLYSRALSVDAAVLLATKALHKHNSRYFTACLAMCYKWKVKHEKRASQEMIERTTELLREVISQYPDSCFRTEIDLANICARSNHSFAIADRKYNELLDRDLEPHSKQILYNNYAKFLYFDKHDSNTSIRFHLKAAEIPVRSQYQTNSIKALEQIRARGIRDQSLRAQVDDFLTSNT